MKTLILSLFAAMILGQAHAEAPMAVQPGSCGMSYGVHIESYLLVSRGYGNGLVVCRDRAGKIRAKSKVAIDINGIGLGLGVFDLQGVAGNIGILEPKQIAGTYAIAEANIAVGGAIGAGLGFYGQQNGLSFTGSVSAGSGFGVYVNGQSWTITPHK